MDVQSKRLWFDTARNGDLERLRRAVEVMGIDVNTQDEKGFTALHLAALHGQVEGMKMLVELGADVHAQDQEGCTLLHVATLNGQVEAV